MSEFPGRRIRFVANWDWKPTPRVTIAYRSGQTVYATRACAERAITLKKAIPVNIGGPPAGIAALIASKTRKKADGP